MVPDVFCAGCERTHKALCYVCGVARRTGDASSTVAVDIYMLPTRIRLKAGPEPSHVNDSFGVEVISISGWQGTRYRRRYSVHGGKFALQC